NEPTIHTQPSIVRIEDGEDSSSESESEDSILTKTDMVPSPMESNVSLLLMPSLDRLSLSEDN
ncbi:unnamed protein product, partial [Rotaria magnacalcarata]